MRQSILLPLVLLAACGQPSRDAAPANANATPTAGGYDAKVAALPAAQRAGVLLRAIRDAGQDCQQVVDASRATTTGGPPAWVATCDDHHQWVVVVADDGSATVVDAKDVARQR